MPKEDSIALQKEVVEVLRTRWFESKLKAATSFSLTWRKNGGDTTSKSWQATPRPPRYPP